MGQIANQMLIEGIYKLKNKFEEKKNKKTGMTVRLFDIDPWKLTTKKFKKENIRLYESLTSIGNGYMGMRGNFEEGFSGDSHKGTYIAGVWFPDKTQVGWWKNGYPQYFGKVINAVDFSNITIELNSRKVDLNTVVFSDFYEELDMHNGLLSRQYIVKDEKAEVKFSFRRFLSITECRLACFEVHIEVLSGTADISVNSVLDGNVRNLDSNYGENFWDILETSENYISMQTKENPFGTPRFVVSSAMENRFFVLRDQGCGKNNNGRNITNHSGKYDLDKTDNNVSIAGEKHVKNSRTEEHFNIVLTAGEEAVLEKYSAVITDRDTPPEKHKELAFSLLVNAVFDEKLAEQTNAWKKRWEKCDVIIDGDDASQQGIRFNIFQLFCTYYGEDHRVNIGPKGFTGEKYGGATYWDTEAYILPMYLSTAEPEVNEKLLKYRYDQLPGARHNASEQGLDGALFPMVTFTGVECHNEWEITFEEIHRNGAIAHAIYNYTNYTGDDTYLRKFGMDVLVELCRFWRSRVHYCTPKDVYMIHGVTGPNEYENNVNNNWYTNYLCRWTLEYTLSCLEKYPETGERLNVTEKETSVWKDIAHKMYLPYDNERGIFVQHDTFLDKDLKTVSEIPDGERPINQHWSWDKILRSCYIKQADVLQGIYFFTDRFTKEEKERNFDFYEPMTVHESSLSACIYSIIASEIGRKQKAMELYLRTSRLDLDNYNNDTEDGLHITSMSGGWLSVVQGFAGMRSYGGKLSFSPECPENWNGYAFTILYRGRRILVDVKKDKAELRLLSGEPLEIELNQKSMILKY